MPNIMALVVPPFALKNSLMNMIKENYKVIEVAQLNVANIMSNELKKKSNKPELVVLSSLDGITEQSRLCNLKLYAFKCQDSYKSEPANNYYLDSESFYAHQTFKSVNSAASVRKEVEKMVKVCNSPQMIKLVNPARMHLSSDEELMVILQLQEPPSVEGSFIDTTQDAAEVVQEPQPEQKQLPAKKTKNKKEKREKPQ